MGWAQAVAFINPGHPGEPYWCTVSESMNAAARSLGVPLEEYFVRREHLRSFEIARSIVARPADKRPDYVIFTNDYGTGPEMLRIFEGSGIRVFLAFSTLTSAQKGRARRATGALQSLDRITGTSGHGCRLFHRPGTDCRGQSPTCPWPGWQAASVGDCGGPVHHLLHSAQRRHAQGRG